MPGASPSRKVLAAWALVLAALVLLVFGPALSAEFIDYDTPEYVSQHALISRGLTWDGLRFVWTSEHVGNWHPLTGLAHMLDAELFGVEDARGHRAVSLLWHVLNTLLVFGLIVRATGAVGRAAFVAALFGVHPLHVESVVWIAERKDVLSTFLGLCATWAWFGYASPRGALDRRSGSRASYLLAASLFALGLCAKAMLVTWPCVLLLFDRWPLGRRPDRSWAALVREKLPLFGISAAFAGVTFAVQSGAGAMDEAARIPPVARGSNAVVAWAAYPLRALWPVDLSVLYPHPALPGGTPLAAWVVASAALGLVLVSALVVLSRRSFAFVAWAGYLGTLVPVIGLVQVGQQATADRYTYVPLLGVFALVAWTAVEVTKKRGVVIERSLAVLGVVLVLAAGALAQRQARRWESTETLFEHSLAARPEPPVLHYNLGRWLRHQGRIDEGIAHYRRALEIQPDYRLARFNLGVALQLAGRHSEAASCYRELLAQEPDPMAHHNLAMLLRKSDLEEALFHHAERLRLQPDSADAHNALAAGWMLRGRLDEAQRLLERALELDPTSAEARENLRRVAAAR